MPEINSSFIKRNNLDNSSSPYLLQHKDNPVWWQEWSDGLVRYAAETRTPLLVSVGYATCHWCHVMAAEAFSDQKTAEFLNNNFICIKIDREQRPDIDQYMMDYITRQNGSGGWPLNVFLSPSLHPVYAITYAPVETAESMYSFLEVAEKVYDYIKLNPEKIVPFPSIEKGTPVIAEDSVMKTLFNYYDSENGGFGFGQKFPPHSTLLYLLYQLAIDDSPSIKTICLKTLDSMVFRGLNDHLQGGIFRYCVDNDWAIPHFEKMLYDQAMALWVFSLAYRVTEKEAYRTMSEKILRCLGESFCTDGLYISAHDADTAHKEGVTYLWSYDELKRELTPQEFSRFSETYHVRDSGNFKGLNHLIRKNDVALDDIEEKLLNIRKKRIQPSCDDKILSGINALTAVAMIQAARFLNKPSLESSAALLVQQIRDKFWNGSSLGHSLYKDNLQEQSFLFDAAALLAAIALLCEKDTRWSGSMDEMADYVRSFREGNDWMESGSNDFQPVHASWFDHPVPSSVSLAEFGLSIQALIREKDLEPLEYRQPFYSDFYNISSMIHNGLFHVCTSRNFIEWELLPVNSVQLRGEHEQDCYMKVCSPMDFTDIDIILKSPL